MPLLAHGLLGFTPAWAAPPADPIKTVAAGNAALKEARRLRELQRNDEALAIFDRIIASYPGNCDLLIERSELLKDMGLMDRSLKDVNRVLVIAPGNLAALAIRAHVNDMTGKLELAITDYDRLVAANKVQAGPLRDRAIAYRRLHRYKEAARDYLKAAEIEPSARDFGKTLYAGGEMLLKSGDAQGALKAFNRLAAAEPHLSTAFWGRAGAYDKLGKIELAKADRAHARKLDEELNGIDGF